MSTATATPADSLGPMIRSYLLSAYDFLRQSVWRSVALFGVVLVIIGFLFDQFGVHDIFAGMFGIWGVSFIIFGLIGYVTIKSIRRYGRIMKEM